MRPSYDFVEVEKVGTAPRKAMDAMDAGYYQ